MFGKCGVVETSQTAEANGELPALFPTLHEAHLNGTSGHEGFKNNQTDLAALSQPSHLSHICSAQREVRRNDITGSYNLAVHLTGFLTSTGGCFLHSLH